MDPTVNPAFVIFAAFAPMLIAFVKQEGFSTQVNAVIALLCYAVVGAAGAIASGVTPTAGNLVAFISVAAVVGTAAYNLFWNNLGVTPSTGVNAEGNVLSFERRITRATSLAKAA